MVRDKKNLSGVDWKLMWTNGNSSANFGAQTISIDLSDYSEIMVTWKLSTRTSVYQNCYAMINGGVEVAYFMASVEAATQMYLNARDFEATSSGVTFSGNTRKGTRATSAGTTSNSYNIPTHIYAR